MKPQKPQKPRKPAAVNAYQQQPTEETTAGQLFRVRDRDWDKVWAENLTHAEAHRLKESLAGRGKSRTARVENMNVAPPDWYTPEVAAGNDPELEQLRHKAVATSQQVATDAERRLLAKRDRSSPAAAGRSARQVPHLVPVVSTVLPEDDDLEIDPNVDTSDISDLLAEGDQPTAADIARAKAQRDQDVATQDTGPKIPAERRAELEVKGRELYDLSCQDRPGSVSWDKLHTKTRDAWMAQAFMQETTSSEAVDSPPA